MGLDAIDHSLRGLWLLLVDLFNLGLARYCLWILDIGLDLQSSQPDMVAGHTHRTRDSTEYRHPAAPEIGGGSKGGAMIRSKGIPTVVAKYHRIFACHGTLPIYLTELLKRILGRDIHENLDL